MTGVAGSRPCPNTPRARDQQEARSRKTIRRLHRDASDYGRDRRHGDRRDSPRRPGSLAAEPLKIGISGEPYPPFTYKSSSGGWTGFEVELADALCDRIDRECTITPTAWSGIIPALNSGKIDVIMNSMSITEKRDRVIDFTDPYYYTAGAYVGPTDMDISIPDGLDGKVLGVQGATTHANFARAALSDTGVEVKIYNKQEQANRDLLAGRVDLILADEIAMQEFLEARQRLRLRDQGQDAQAPSLRRGHRHRRTRWRRPAHRGAEQGDQGRARATAPVPSCPESTSAPTSAAPDFRRHVPKLPGGSPRRPAAHIRSPLLAGGRRARPSRGAGSPANSKKVSLSWHGRLR
ncbi:MAG: transporter substrate-binding domain-containing protein [Rhodovibrio sp.]|nr:transporter substrate-binding domain-containing protein [Rhodovibrio sp.]